jgi:hypothetical protein
MVPTAVIAEKCKASLTFIKEAREFWWKEKLAQYAEAAAKSWLPWRRSPSEATLRREIVWNNCGWSGDRAYKDKEERINKLLDACDLERDFGRMLLSVEDAAILAELRYKNVKL